MGQVSLKSECGFQRYQGSGQTQTQGWQKNQDFEKKTNKPGFFIKTGLNQGFFQNPFFFKNDCVLLYK